MPIYQIHCPDCEHIFSGMVFEGTRLPQKWVCPECGKDGAQLQGQQTSQPHPLESAHPSGCPCCGSGRNNKKT